MSDVQTLPMIAAHGAARLPAVDVDSYNTEVKDDEGFIGDRASKGAFRNIVENWRKPLRKQGEDPFGDLPSKSLTKKEFDEALAKGDLEAAGVIQGAVEDFSQELAVIIRRYLKLKSWKDTERIVVGGGFRASRVGEIAIGRTSVILKADPRPGTWREVLMAKRKKRVPAKRAGPKKLNYPIAETIDWVRDGERLLRKWGAIKSPRAKRVTALFSKLLNMLEMLTALRNVQG
jgi:hypothetical protein